MLWVDLFMGLSDICAEASEKVFMMILFILIIINNSAICQ